MTVYHRAGRVRISSGARRVKGDVLDRASSRGGMYLDHKVYLALRVPGDFPFNLPANCSYFLSGLGCNGCLMS